MVSCKVSNELNVLLSQVLLMKENQSKSFNMNRFTMSNKNISTFVHVFPLRVGINKNFNLFFKMTYVLRLAATFMGSQWRLLWLSPADCHAMCRTNKGEFYNYLIKRIQILMISGSIKYICFLNYLIFFFFVQGLYIAQAIKCLCTNIEYILFPNIYSRENIELCFTYCSFRNTDRFNSSLGLSQCILKKSDLCVSEHITDIHNL